MKCQNCDYCLYPRTVEDNGGNCKCKAMKYKTIDIYVCGGETPSWCPLKRNSAEETNRLTDTDIIRLWKEQRGPIHLKQYLDQDVTYEKIIGIEFCIKSNNDSYISGVTLVDRSGSLMTTQPDRIYTGSLKKKHFGMHI